MKATDCSRVLAALFAVLVASMAIANEASQTSSVRSQDGTRIEYLAVGSGDPAVILIHGWKCDRSYWSAQIDHFAENYRVVAIDLAGHGDSGLQRQDYTMTRFGHDVAAAAVGDFPVILVGHSMGASVMLEAAELLGNRVLGLVAVDSLKQVPRVIPDAAAINARLAPMMDDYGKTTREFIPSMFPPDADPALRDRIVNDMMSGDARVATSSVRGLMAMDYVGAFADISAPLVLINSQHPPTDMDALTSLYTDSRLETMESVGHFLMMERPAAFNALLDSVIASITDPD